MARKTPADRRLMLLAPVEAAGWSDPLNILFVHLTIAELKNLKRLLAGPSSVKAGAGKGLSSFSLPGSLSAIGIGLTSARLALPAAAQEWAARNQVTALEEEKTKDETWTEYAMRLTAHASMVKVNVLTKPDIRMLSRSDRTIDEPDAVLTVYLEKKRAVFGGHIADQSLHQRRRLEKRR